MVSIFFRVNANNLATKTVPKILIGKNIEVGSAKISTEASGESFKILDSSHPKKRNWLI